MTVFTAFLHRATLQWEQWWTPHLAPSQKWHSTSQPCSRASVLAPNVMKRLWKLLSLGLCWGASCSYRWVLLKDEIIHQWYMLCLSSFILKAVAVSHPYVRANADCWVCVLHRESVWSLEASNTGSRDLTVVQLVWALLCCLYPLEVCEFNSLQANCALKREENL